MTVKFDISQNDRQINVVIQDAIRRGQDPRPMIKEILELLSLSADERFETETDPDLVPWRKLSRFRLAQKRQQGLIDKILQGRGTGRASVNYGLRGNVGYIGTNLKYMADHQLGRGVPQRRWLGPTEEDRIDINEIVARRSLGQRGR